jgi:hypothetical protein
MLFQRKILFDIYQISQMNESQDFCCFFQHRIVLAMDRVSETHVMIGQRKRFALKNELLYYYSSQLIYISIQLT